jgi:hypothetical protein
MKHRDHATKLFSFLLSALLILVASASAKVTGQTAATAPPVLSPQEKQLIKAFDGHVKDYLKQRGAVKKKLKPLSKDATPEQIDAYQKSFVKELQAMRAGTKQGYIYSPQFTEYVRSVIKTEFPAKDKAEIKEAILEAETKGVPLKVNYPYPESKELSQVPPTLLLKLPQLPKEVKYRFVGRHLLLVDSDNSMIVDYTLNALP